MIVQNGKLISGFQKPYLPVYTKLLCQHDDITQEMMNHCAKKLHHKIIYRCKYSTISF